jgi:hypothetical protein
VRRGGAGRPGRGRRLGPEDHAPAFLAFTASLLAAFDRYVEGTPAPDLARDGVGYRMVGLWLTDEELGELVRDVASVVAHRQGNRPQPGRCRRLVAGVLLPVLGDGEATAREVGR